MWCQSSFLLMWTIQTLGWVLGNLKQIIWLLKWTFSNERRLCNKNKLRVCTLFKLPPDDSVPSDFITSVFVATERLVCWAGLLLCIPCSAVSHFVTDILVKIPLKFPLRSPLVIPWFGHTLVFILKELST